MKTSLPEELSDREIERAYWFVTHRQAVYRLLIAVLILLSVASYSTTLYVLVNNYIIHQDEHDALMADFSRNYVNYDDFKAKDAPGRLQVVGTNVIEAGEGRYDFMAIVHNINPQWLALIEYNFTAPGVTTETRTDYILPQQEKYLVILGNESTSRIGNARINITSLRWKKVLSFDKVRDNAWQFEIIDNKFISSSELRVGGTLPISRLDFDLKNNTPYNFWKVRLVAILYSGTRPVGVNEITVDSLGAGELRPIESTWFNSLPKVTDSEVVVDVDILDEANYKSFTATPDIDIRDYFQNQR